MKDPDSDEEILSARKSRNASCNVFNIYGDEELEMSTSTADLLLTPPRPSPGTTILGNTNKTGPSSSGQSGMYRYIFRRKKEN
jgi:hypothetical protein